jgi:hypothetical protein
MARKNMTEGLNQDSKITENTLTLGDVNLDDLTSLGFEEVDPLKGIDAAYNAGQEGFLPGTTKLGYFEGTKLCVSTPEKKPNWKEHPTLEDKVCRGLHIFRSVGRDGEMLKTYFGIWSAGALDAMLKRIRPHQILAITYEGLADKPFKKGQSNPHVFKLRGRGLEIRMSDLAEIEPDVEGTEVVTNDLTQQAS